MLVYIFDRCLKHTCILYHRMKLLTNSGSRYLYDGLNTMAYQAMVRKEKLFTYVLFDIDSKHPAYQLKSSDVLQPNIIKGKSNLETFTQTVPKTSGSKTSGSLTINFDLIIVVVILFIFVVKSC